MPVWAPAPMPITRWLSQYHQSPSASWTTRGARSLNVGSALVVHRSAGSKTWLSDEMIRYPDIRHPPQCLCRTNAVMPVARWSWPSPASPDLEASSGNRVPTAGGPQLAAEGLGRLALRSVDPP